MYVLLALVLAVVAWRSLGGEGNAEPAPAAASVVRRSERPHLTLVYVTGEVRRPGVYRVGGDLRVIQAVRVAGGPTARADMTHLNLAARIVDGQQVIVPAKVPRAVAIASGGRATPSAPLSLSSATQADLEALDGVGPALAARIIVWRDSHGGFSSVDQLDEVSGIGPARMETLRPILTP